MKSGIMTLIISVCLILVIISMVIINNSINRKNEVEESLSIAIDQTMHKLAFDKKYAVGEEDKLIADLLQSIIVNTNSDGDIQVDILKIDIEEGLLDIEVTQTYKITGKEKKISIRRTMILDEYMEEGIVDSRVIFNIDGSNCVYWIDINGNIYKDERIPDNMSIDFSNIVLSSSDVFVKNGVVIDESDLDDEIILYIQDSISKEKLLSIKGWYEDGGIGTAALTEPYKITMDVMFRAITN